MDNNEMNTNIIVDQADVGMRLDLCVLKYCSQLSRSMIQKLISDGNVLVNKEFCEKRYKVKSGDIIEVEIPQPTSMDAVAQHINLDIVYEDDDIVVVNKQKGIVVHPAVGNPDGTLVNALLYHCKGSLSGIGGVLRPGIVHRLDKDTSGILIVAKNDFSHIKLAEQIKGHNFLREYEAIVHGKMKEESGTINMPIGRSQKDRKKMAVIKNGGKEAITKYSLVSQYDKYAHLRVKLETGRTHQIRVHMSNIGHYVAGDTVYGSKKLTKHEQNLNGQCLHAKKIGFYHPKTEQWMEFETELPTYFKEFLEKLNKNIF